MSARWRSMQVSESRASPICRRPASWCAGSGQTHSRNANAPTASGSAIDSGASAGYSGPNILLLTFLNPHGRPKTEMIQSIEALKARMGEIGHLHNVASVLEWDLQTYMPPGGAQARSEQIGFLSRLAHDMF